VVATPKAVIVNVKVPVWTLTTVGGVSRAVMMVPARRSGIGGS
jgi:hypothetical protein